MPPIPSPQVDDGASAAQAASLARASRQAARLATETNSALATLVDALRARLEQDGDGGGAARAAGDRPETLLAALESVLDAGRPGLPPPERETVLAALNGVLGDQLANSASPLALRMALRHVGHALTLARAALASALPQAGGKLLILIHDLGMNDLQWHRPGGHDHGQALAAALGFTPVALHYNSGLRVSTNGRALAGLLARLLDEWPHPLERFALVAHGSGGLLARSALHYGLAAGHHWPHRLDDLVALGTPHHGAPAAHVRGAIEALLADTPYAEPLARLGGLHKAGIDDLCRGNLLDEDWAGAAARTGAATDRRQAVPLPAGTRCYAIAGSGLVPVASALGKHRLARRTLQFRPAHQRIFEGIVHLQLLSSPEVAEQLCDWLRH